jgi:hypothetical protein
MGHHGASLLALRGRVNNMIDLPNLNQPEFRAMRCLQPVHAKNSENRWRTAGAEAIPTPANSLTMSNTIAAAGHG